MEASTYAWVVILTFFVLYGSIQLRKCFLELLSSGERTTSSTNRLSTSSVYTIENDSVGRCKDDLPTYEEVIASDKLNPINYISTSSRFTSDDASVVGTTHSSNNVTTSNTTTVDR